MKVRIIFLMVTVAMLSATLARGTRIPGEISFKLAQGFGIVVRGGIGPLNNLKLPGGHWRGSKCFERKSSVPRRSHWESSGRWHCCTTT